jgi:hypothetical protein
MSDVERLKRVLLALPELGLRIGWLRDHLAEIPVADAARQLNALCEESERSNPDAREAHLALALAVISLGECATVDALRKVAQTARLFSLERMLRRGPAPLAAQEPSVPDYGAGRELTLGERKSLARRPNRQSFEKLLGDPHPLVIRQLLKNSKLVENDVVKLVTRRPLAPAVIQEIAQAPTWLCRRRVRMSILLNPGSPASVTMPLLGVSTRTELREIVASTDAAVVLRATALELLERRPPLRRADTADLPVQ